MAREADEAHEPLHQTTSPTAVDAQLGGSFDTGWPAKSLWSAPPRPRPTSQAIPSPSPAVNERELFGGGRPRPGEQARGPLSSDRKRKLDARVGGGGDRPLRGRRPSTRVFPDDNETFMGYTEKEVVLEYGGLIRGGHDKNPRHEKTPEELWVERMIRRDLRSIEYLEPRAQRSKSMRGHYRMAARDARQRLQENLQWLRAARGHRMTLQPGSWSWAASDPDFTTGHIGPTREPVSSSSSSNSDSNDEVSTYERLASRARRRIPRLLRHLREMEAHSLTLQGKSTTHGRGLTFPPLSQHGERRIARALENARRRIRDAHVEVCRATAEADNCRAEASAAAAAAAAATEASDIDAAVASLDVRKHGWDAVPRPLRKKQRRLSSSSPPPPPPPAAKDGEDDAIDDGDNNSETDRIRRRQRAAKCHAQLKEEIRQLKQSLGMASFNGG